MYPACLIDQDIYREQADSPVTVIAAIRLSRRLILSMLITAGLLTGCAAIEDEETSQSFHVISETKLHSNMQLMASMLSTITAEIMDNSKSPETKRDQVIPLLDQIEVVAGTLGGGPVVTNYSVINRYMGAFLYDVSIARRFANSEPPNLVPAGRLVKSCLSCHDSI